MERKEKVVVFWFRRDLRIEDNVGLYFALNSGYRVLPLFIFDKSILARFSRRDDARVDYIHQAIKSLNNTLKDYHTSVMCLHTTASEAYDKLFEQYDIAAIYCNEDYEPTSIDRDNLIAKKASSRNISFFQYKDHVIFKGGEILKSDGTPYQIYTPYAKMWRVKLDDRALFDYTTVLCQESFVSVENDLPTLEELGFERSSLDFTRPILDEGIISSYDKNRDYPAIEGTTRLGIALRFGTISIRKCVNFALRHNEVWLKELIWRDFFSQIMYLFPQVVNSCFKEKYERVNWRNNEEEFDLWCKGQTGYPLVDAGMRELNETGFMHNRVRMVVASFLTKHLLIDWRWGEAYFAQYLLDYDLASNNGNWQWAAGCGCDAAPYFRIFNPLEQQKKFDKTGVYIRKWVQEFDSLDYKNPMVDNKEARIRAIETYKKALI
ncbi:cryptochrome/photolyase family protein [Myroides sp. LoEW2-1]|uniref:cryptochrome/photolyase family protein n=1 Tax=Myroides sp. LoEW2-1 TaxID=2683192 RepID=UPI001324BE83|nr:deoxyribodipyrimidine photo-lyase [Myroides sp. LoEW2-1]MVX36619.1 deoxyribodipyrimidine photo-lyase [Myroides sp. LoEW2-1]